MGRWTLPCALVVSLLVCGAFVAANEDRTFCGHRNCYDVLGLKETAEPADIKAAYRKLSMTSHPDKNPDVPDAKAKFEAIARAYEILSATASRREYDWALKHPSFQPPKSSFRAPAPPRPVPVWIVVPVTLALFCALHWMSMRQSYAHYMRNLRGSSDYKEKKRQLREIKLAERDQAKGAAKRNKKAHKQALEGVTVAEDEVLDRMLVEAPEQPQILDVFLFWPVRAVIRLTKPKDSVDEDGTSDDVPKLKSL